MKVAFLFSGQGAQTVGMMKDICEGSQAAKAVFMKADKLFGRSISTLCFDGSQEELNLTHNTQPCVLVAELATVAALEEYGVKPDAVAGFSLGEYAALTAAGAISADDVFRVIQIRADAMQAACPIGKGAMAAITKQDAATVQKLCDEVSGYVVPVNYNCPGQIVVSGEAEAVDKVCELAKERKIRAVRLAVSVPSHCVLMAPAAETLSEVFATVSFCPTTIPCYSAVDALPYRADADIAGQLCCQVQSPVLWEQTLRNMYKDGINMFVEIGPGKTLSGFVKKTFQNGENVQILNVSDLESLDRTTIALRR